MTVLAGGGTMGGNGEYDPSDVRFGNIGDVVRGHDGIIYISDTNAYCVRKLDADGKIRAVAGVCGQRANQTQPWAGSAPASQTKLYSPQGLALDADGNLLIADSGLWRVFKITREGLIHSYIGRGYDPDYSREPMESPEDICITPTALALATNGDLYVTGSSGSEYLYKRSNDGRMSIVAGNFEALYGEPSYYGSGNPPGSSFNPATMAISVGVLAVDGEGALLFNDLGNNLRRMRQVLPGFDGGDILIPETDGRQAYLFDARGRHQKTLDALTGAALYTFSYDGNGILIGVTDFDGKTTQIQRSEGTTTITGPSGHQTKLILQNGKLVEVQDPSMASWKFEYDDGGSMTKFTDPNNQSNLYVYDASKRLLSNIWPNGGGWTMWDIWEDVDYWTKKQTTILVSGEGRIYNYADLDYPYNQSKSSKASTNPDGSSSQSFTNAYGYPAATTTKGDQRNSAISSVAGDPRFGLIASYTSSSSSNATNWVANAAYWDGGYWTTIPNSYTTSSRTRFTEVNDDDTLFLVKKWGEQQWFNSVNPSGQVYDHEEGTWTTTSESGRVSKTWVDAIHRPLKAEAPGAPTTLYTYDQGKVTQIEAKPAEGTSRFWKNEYDAQGNLSKAFDPLNRAVTYEYDAVGRVTKQTLSDGRSVQQRYDAMGNLIELTTPAGEKHLFNFDAMGDKERYTPPQIGNTDTRYFYNKDRQPAARRFRGELGVRPAQRSSDHHQLLRRLPRDGLRQRLASREHQRRR